MKSISRILVGAVVVSLLLMAGACEPKHKKESVASQGRICFKIDPADAVIYVDGTAAGPASEFTLAKGCMALEAGTHSIRIEKDGFLPYQRETYVSSSTMSMNIKLTRSE